LINQAERFFARLTDKQIRRGVHRSVPDPRNAMPGCIVAHNASPKPFRWTRPADDMLASIERFCFRNIPAEPAS
jgi:hypothetical protein